MGETHRVEVERDLVVDPAAAALRGDAPAEHADATDTENKIRHGEHDWDSGKNTFEPTDTAAIEGDRPAWLLDKFENPEALAKAYDELQAKMGGASESVETTENPLQIKKAEPAQTPAFDAEKYTKEMIADGKLSAESMKQLKDSGIPKELIDVHLQGLEAIREAQISKLNSIAGGEESWERMKLWAANNMNPDQIEVFNQAIQSGDPAKTEMAMSGLKAIYSGSTAGQSTALEGKTGGPAVEPFKSTAEMTAAMSDPRYDKDPSYRNSVMQKLRGM